MNIIIKKNLLFPIYILFNEISYKFPNCKNNIDIIIMKYLNLLVSH